MTGCSVGVEDMEPFRPPYGNKIESGVSGGDSPYYVHPKPSTADASRQIAKIKTRMEVETLRREAETKALKDAIDVALSVQRDRIDGLSREDQLIEAHNEAAAAHSHDPNVRYAGVEGVERFIADLSAGRLFWTRR